MMSKYYLFLLIHISFFHISHFTQHFPIDFSIVLTQHFLQLTSDEETIFLPTAKNAFPSQGFLNSPHESFQKSSRQSSHPPWAESRR
jgi:hypothetical protein